jgi:hypothetical protein
MKGRYVLLEEDMWSTEIRAIIKACLQVKSSNRPSITQVLAMVPPTLLQRFDPTLAEEVSRRTARDEVDLDGTGLRTCMWKWTSHERGGWWCGRWP